MTISTTDNRHTYAGDDSTTAFAYSFPIQDDDDISVYLMVDATGAVSLKTKTTHYTVSGVGSSSGGNVTFLTAPATGQTVILLRNEPVKQTTDYTANDAFPAETHELALDHAIAVTQMHDEELDRAIKLHRGETATDVEIPDLSVNAGYFLKINDAGTGLDAIEVDTLSGTFADVVDDTSPQLGGDLDVNGNDIISVSNGDINITPNGAGTVNISDETVTTSTITTLTGTDATFSTSLEVPNGAGGTTVNATGEVTVDSTSKTMNFYDGSAEKVLNPEKTVSITVEDPESAEDISIFFTNAAITVTEMRAVLVGSSTPSVTWTVRHGTDRSATGAEVVTSGTTTTSTTTGSDVTSFNDATIVADSFIWLETTAQSGTVTELSVTIKYTQDA